MKSTQTESKMIVNLYADGCFAQKALDQLAKEVKRYLIERGAPFTIEDIVSTIPTGSGEGYAIIYGKDTKKMAAVRKVLRDDKYYLRTVFMIKVA